MSRKSSHVGLVLAGLVGVGLSVAVVAWMRPAPKPVGQTEGEDDVPAFANEGNETEGARARAYNLTFTQDLAPEHGGAARLAVRARLEIAPRDAAGRDLVRLSSVVAEGEGLPAAADLETVFARFHDGGGHLEGIAFAAGTSPEARRYLKAIAAALQFTGPSVASDREWRATELDVGGRFVSTYRRIDGAHVERFQRRFLDNPDVIGPSMGMKLDGLTRFSFDDAGVLAALETHESADLSADKSWRLRATLVVSLVHVGDATVAWRRPFAGLERERLIVAVEKPQTSSAADRARVAGRSLSDLRAQAQHLEGITDVMERARARSQLLLDHAALIRLNPTVAIEIAERMKDAAISQSEMSLLAGGLAGAGTVEASHALGEVLGEAKRTDARAQAAVGLNVATAHDGETLDALTKGMTDADPEVASASTLALGSASRTLRNAGGSGAAAAEVLARTYREAGNVEARLAAIRAIGNSGDSSMLSLLEQAMQDADPDVQAAAVYALRFMDASAEPLLARALTIAYADVRSAAVRAIEFRALDPLVGALQGALARETDADVRTAIARVLARVV